MEPIKNLFLVTVFTLIQNIRWYCWVRWRQLYCTPSGVNAALARGKVNRSRLEKGAMDNATPATTNNTRMEKRIALECGKRKPDEVQPRSYRALKMSSKQL